MIIWPILIYRNPFWKNIFWKCIKGALPTSVHCTVVRLTSAPITHGKIEEKKNTAYSGIRTHIFLVSSLMLYQLSYRGIQLNKGFGWANVLGLNSVIFQTAKFNICCKHCLIDYAEAANFNKYWTFMWIQDLLF